MTINTYLLEETSDNDLKDVTKIIYEYSLGIMNPLFSYSGA